MPCPLYHKTARKARACSHLTSAGDNSRVAAVISQNQQDEELFNTITAFFKTFKIGDLLRKCNACKQKGVPVLDIFKYKLCNVFCLCFGRTGILQFLLIAACFLRRRIKTFLVLKVPLMEDCLPVNGENFPG